MRVRRRPTPVTSVGLARSTLALAVAGFSACTWVDPRAITRFACEDGGCRTSDGGPSDGGDAGSARPDAGPGDGGDTGRCTASSLVATGSLETTIGNIDYSGTAVEVEAAHAVYDSNPIDDGCIARTFLTFRRPGGGCTLQLIFDAFGGASRGLLQARFVADSSCPGLDAGVAGTYDSEPGYGHFWYTGPSSVGQRRATSACLSDTTLSFPKAAITLWRELPTSASLTLDLSGLVLTGDLLTQGDDMAGCGDGSGCAVGYHSGGPDWCVSVGTCSRGWHDDGAGTCVASGCVPRYADCGGPACIPESATACGAQCATCPPPASNGVATCVSGLCDLRCSPEFFPCGGDCVRLTTATDCGACGRACSDAERCYEGGCSDPEWVLWPIPSDPKSDALYQIQTGTVTDVASGLHWQRTVSSDLITHDQARSYCAGLSLADGGWRLPTLAELESLVDLTRAGASAINPTAFPGTPEGHFWSSTTYAFDAGSTWAVFFGQGPSNFRPMTSTHRVRCVR